MKLTGELTEKIAESIRNGNSPRDSAIASGIAESTFYLWMDRGREGVAPFSEFLETVERAVVDARVDVVKRLIEIGREKDWRALAWWLERADPERYGKQEPRRTDVEGNWSAGLTMNKVSIADLEARVRRVIEARRPGRGIPN